MSKSSYGFGALIRMLFERNHAERRQIDAYRMALTLPGNGIRVDAAEIADIAAAIRFGVRIQDLFVPPFANSSNPISVTRDWGSVDDEDQDWAILRLTDISDNAVIGVVEIDPFKSFVRIIQLPQCRLVFVKVIQVLDETPQAVVHGDL